MSELTLSTGSKVTPKRKVNRPIYSYFPLLQGPDLLQTPMRSMNLSFEGADWRSLESNKDLNAEMRCYDAVTCSACAADRRNEVQQVLLFRFEIK